MLMLGFSAFPFMNRIDRLNVLLIHLQGKLKVQIPELEEHFVVSRRTIFRDIRSLN